MRKLWYIRYTVVTNSLSLLKVRPFQMARKMVLVIGESFFFKENRRESYLSLRRPLKTFTICPSVPGLRVRPLPMEELPAMLFWADLVCGFQVVSLFRVRSLVCGARPFWRHLISSTRLFSLLVKFFIWDLFRPMLGIFTRHSLWKALMLFMWPFYYAPAFQAIKEKTFYISIVRPLVSSPQEKGREAEK